MVWPSVEDLKDFLIAAGLYSDPPSAFQSRLDLDGALSAAIYTWNDRTHYWPFLSTGNVNEKRYFDPKVSRIIDLDGGLLTLTSIYTDLQYEAGGNNSLSAGTERVNFRDFRLKPTNASMKGKPWTYIETGWTQSGIVGSIAVTGEWGFCTSANLPAAAKRGVLALAADLLMGQITYQLTRGGLTMLQRGDETKRWDAKSVSEGWQKEVADILAVNGFVRQRIST